MIRLRTIVLEIFNEGRFDVGDRPKNLPPEMTVLYKKHDDLFHSAARETYNHTFVDARVAKRLLNQTRQFYHAVNAFFEKERITDKSATKSLFDAKRFIVSAHERMEKADALEVMAALRSLGLALSDLDQALNYTHDALDAVAVSMEK